jgi:hypothetical protein
MDMGSSFPGKITLLKGSGGEHGRATVGNFPIEVARGIIQKEIDSYLHSVQHGLVLKG